MKRLITFIGTILMSMGVQAQGDWLWMAHQYLEPTFGQRTVFASVDYKLNSNQLSNALVGEALFDGEIQASTAEVFTTNGQTNDVRVGGYARGGVWYTSNAEGIQPVVGFGFTEHGGGVLKHDLVGLFLAGNGQYEGRNIELGPSKLEYFGFQNLSLGFQKNGAKSSYGLVLNILRGSGYQMVELLESDLFTAPFGEYIEANINLTTSAVDTAGSSWAGSGASLSTYWSWMSDDGRNAMFVSLSDFGALRFGELMTSYADSAYSFRGVEVDNFLAISDSVFSQSGSDSLNDILGIRTGTESRTVFLPLRLNVQYMRQVGEKLRARAGVSWFGRSGALPLVHAALAWKPRPTFSIEPQLAYGGWGALDFSLALGVQPMRALQVFANLNLVELIVNPKESTGQGAFVGAALNF